MRFDSGWSRRRFLALTTAAAARAAAGLKGFGQAQRGSTSTDAAQATNAAATTPPPGVITGGIQPLMESMTARPLRYRPVSGDFVIRNGKEFFNRPIYGVSTPTQVGDFRVDAGDLPEFSLYLPGHGGNLKLGFIGAGSTGSKWAAEADEVVASYRPGRMIYEIRDALLGKGMVRAELLTTGEGKGLLLKIDGHGIPAGAKLAWAFGGVSGKKGRRGGDIGCEVEPVSQFFQVRPEECDGNRYAVGGGAKSSVAALSSKAAEMTLAFPPGSRLAIEGFEAWTRPPGWDGGNRDQPVLTGSADLANQSLYITIAANAEGDAGSGLPDDPAKVFAARSAQVEATARTLTLDTPDDYMNTVGPALSIAADTIWDVNRECVMHGAVAWRQAYLGWRGPYVLDALGNHDRAVVDIRHWLKRQNVTPVTTGDPATGPWDANSHLTRKEKLLHSNGDIENSHYDMNLVFIDMLLRHLMWTGDLEFAREIWPALQRHLAWEHRLFRRTYTTPDGKVLPLYEAYAAIWASDNLQYNGGGAAHSSAYNAFAFRFAAKLAQGTRRRWDGA